MNKNSIYINKFRTTITFKNRLEDYQRELYTFILSEIKKKSLFIEETKRKECHNYFSLELDLIINFLPKKKRNINTLIKEIKELQDNWIDFKKEEDIFFTISYISYFTYSKKDNTFSIEIPKVIIKSLLYPESLPLIDLVMCKGFKSKYFVHMYDLLLNDDSKEVIDFSLDELKRELYIKPSQYTSFWTLKEKVLKPVLEELNNFKSIKFKEIKEKNKIIGVTFFKK